MNKLICIIMVIMSFAFFGCNNIKKQYALYNKYKINVELDTKKNKLYGNEIIEFPNTSEQVLKDIYIHIYPNAFKNERTAPVLFSSMKYAYPTGFNEGKIDIINVSEKNNKIKYSVEGPDDTILHLRLDRDLKPGSFTAVNIEFEISVPHARERLGYYDGTYNFGNWYPILAVYDEQGWHIDQFYPVGDPFYSATGNYEVNIAVPENFLVASTGEVVREEIKNGKRLINIKENSVRDFAWVTSNKFYTYERQIDGINIKCYFMDTDMEKQREMEKSSENAIKIFNGAFGKYPYKNYSVVETNFPAGMEYPELVFIGEGFFKPAKTLEDLEGVIVHETAHQWWYGVVGNDEVDEAWLDEGFATYSKIIYYERMYGKIHGKEFYENNILSKYNSRRKNIRGREIILKPLSEFEGWKDYDQLVYEKGAMLLNELRNELGDDMFFDTLTEYFKRYKFKIASTEGFIDVVHNKTNKNWDKFFYSWLNGTK